MFPLPKCPIVITALFWPHNFLKKFENDSVVDLLAVNSGPGHHREGEHFCTTLEPNGYGHCKHFPKQYIF
jgi:hypothetical protein